MHRGRPLRFRITAGQAHDITAAPALLEGQEAGAVLADKAYDSNDLRETIAQMEAQAVIPSNAIARSSSRKILTSTNSEIGSSDASVASSISGASQLATTDAPSTSPASFTSPPGLVTLNVDPA
jgi:hypothetical protein